jgi:hypothetical protein
MCWEYTVTDFSIFINMCWEYTVTDFSIFINYYTNSTICYIVHSLESEA